MRKGVEQNREGVLDADVVRELRDELETGAKMHPATIVRIRELMTLPDADPALVRELFALAVVHEAQLVGGRGKRLAVMETLGATTLSLPGVTVLPVGEGRIERMDGDMVVEVCTAKRRVAARGRVPSVCEAVREGEKVLVRHAVTKAVIMKTNDATERPCVVEMPEGVMVHFGAGTMSCRLHEEYIFAVAVGMNRTAMMRVTDDEGEVREYHMRVGRQDALYVLEQAGKL